MWEAQHALNRGIMTLKTPMVTVFLGEHNAHWTHLHYPGLLW